MIRLPPRRSNLSPLGRHLLILSISASISLSCPSPSPSPPPVSAPVPAPSPPLRPSVRLLSRILQLAINHSYGKYQTVQQWYPCPHFQSLVHIPRHVPGCRASVSPMDSRLHGRADPSRSTSRMVSDRRAMRLGTLPCQRRIPIFTTNPIPRGGTLVAGLSINVGSQGVHKSLYSHANMQYDSAPVQPQPRCFLFLAQLISHCCFGAYRDYRLVGRTVGSSGDVLTALIYINTAFHINPSRS